MFDPITSALADLKQGKIIIIVDDESRENEGDLVMAAELCKPDDVNFMINRGKGIVCVPMELDLAMRLGFPLMTRKHEKEGQCQFTVSCDAREGITTGVSAAERSRTIRKLADEFAVEEDFICPGHVFPPIADPGGLAVRQGHTEATVELLRRAQLSPVGVICEIIGKNGEMMRRDELMEFAKKSELKVISIEQLWKEISI